VNINVHIERLLLDGVVVKNQARFCSAVRDELASRLSEHGLAPAFRQGGAHPFVSAGNISWDGSGGEAQLGNQIARAIHSSIGEKK
jgi:hypothetical protein